jgi:hypothetical protein
VDDDDDEDEDEDEDDGADKFKLFANASFCVCKDWAIE